MSTLYASDGAADAGLGTAVDLGGDAAVVGGSGLAVVGDAAYVFRRIGASWIEETRLIPFGCVGSSDFGRAVAIDGDLAVVGDSRDGQGGISAGAGSRPGLAEDCNGNWVHDACDLAIGDSADCQGDGVPDECQPCAADVDCNGTIGFDDVLVVLSSWGPCVVTPPFGSSSGYTPELEACGDDANDGCSLGTPVFNPIVCGETVSGTAWWDSTIGLRDVDWYEVVVSEPTAITLRLTAQFESRLERVYNEGIADCGGIFCCPYEPELGAPGETIKWTDELTPGTHWFTVGSSFLGPDVLCDGGSDELYVLALECTPEPVVTCNGDVDGDGIVGFGDLLAVLSSWGPCR